MDNRGKNTNDHPYAKSMGMAAFMHGIRSKITNALKESVKQIGTRGSYRSMYYVSPADFYNHSSKTFLQNKRKGL